MDYKMILSDIEKACKIFGDNEFTQKQWTSAMYISLQTALSINAVIPCSVKTDREYYTVQEIVKLLNACAGEDNWGCDWHFEIDEEGRVYEEVEQQYYHMAPVVFTES